jgi:radical SAM superfamily enzyme YgiQ (UPF0313 family)
VLLLSCLTATIDRGREIAREYKEVRREAGLESKTVVGGIHASLAPQDVVNDFDQVAIWECENIILDIISGKLKDKIVYGEKVRDLDKLPIPDFSIVKGGEDIDILPVMTSRGCPYNCDFCSITEMFGREYRMQSPERTLEILLGYQESGFFRKKKRGVFIVDDHFAANTARSMEIMNLMELYGFGMNWTAQLRANAAKNPELVSAMRKAGCDSVCIGYESINPASLREMKKGQTVEEIEHSIRVLKDNGISINGMFMFGNDSDTKDTFRMTSEFCHKNDIHFVQYSIKTPLPGTSFYERILQEGRLLHSNWPFFDGMHAVFKPKNMTALELQQGMIKVYQDFYSYSRAARDAIGLLLDRITTPVKKMYTNAHFSSTFPLKMKFAGRMIVKNWLENNKHYLEYLSGRPNAIFAKSQN